MTLHTAHQHALYLALDQGGHASRALVFDAAGHVLSSAFVAIDTQRQGDDRVEHDAEALVASVLLAAQQATANVGERAREIVAAGLATQRSSIVCWDRVTGAALTPVISWQDRRAATWLQQFDYARDDVHSRTGLMLSPHYGASKLRWCLDHVPAVRAAAAAQRLAYGPLASFLTYRLTQQHSLCVDPANGGRTLLWNRHTRDWDPHLSALFGVPLAPLPPCWPSRAVFGVLCAPAPAVPLRVVTGDQSAALFAHGEPNAGRIYINLGTGAFLQHIQPRAVAAPRLLHSVVFDDGHNARCALEGTVNGAGSALAWWAERDGIAHWAESAVHWLNDERSPPLFINGVGGVGSPYWQPQLESHFIGAGDSGQRFRAVMESIVFLLQTNLFHFAASGVAAKELWVSGGVSQQDALCQWLADLADRPVVRPAECEATGRGLAWLLASGSSPPAFVTTPQRIFAPHPDPALRERYTRWRMAMGQLTGERC